MMLQRFPNQVKTFRQTYELEEAAVKRLKTDRVKVSKHHIYTGKVGLGQLTDTTNRKLGRLATR